MNYITGDYKENIYTDKAPLKYLRKKVIKDYKKNRNPTQAINMDYSRFRNQETPPILMKWPHCLG